MSASSTRLVFLTVLLTFLAIPFTAAAGNRAGAVTVSPLIGTHIFKKNEQLKNGDYYGARLGYNVTKNVGLELEGTWSMVTDEVALRDFQYYTGTLNFLYHFNPDGKFVPYVALGAGGTFMDTDIPGHDVNEDLLADYGLGFKYFTTDWLALRIDARHAVRHEIEWAPVDHGKNYSNFMLSGGLTFQLGGEEARPRVVDADGDGVIDSLDRCAATPAGVSVDAYGCPLDSDHDGVIDAVDQCRGTEAGVEVDSVGCAVIAAPATETMINNDDLDGDGVPNQLDKCPNTPAGMPVNERGCLSDSDHDGVFDIDDNCPQTPSGTRVGPDGCPDQNAAPIVENFAQMDEMKLNIEFGSNSSKIAPSYVAELKRAAAFSKAHPAAILIVEGHTDNTGSSIANQKLSQHRADTVRWILVRDYGADPKKIVARGFGERQPVAGNDTQEGRKANRRVVIRLMD